MESLQNSQNFATLLITILFYCSTCITAGHQLNMCTKYVFVIKIAQDNVTPMPFRICFYVCVAGRLAVCALLSVRYL